MPWDENVHDLICEEFGIGAPFTLDQVYAYEDHFERRYPGNRHVREDSPNSSASAR
ncbi:MAG: hypothetical protein HC801_07435 [Nitrospira sp.]|nr:hypothetical protein [Nitrospira sp.]